MAQGAFRVYRDAATRRENIILPLGTLYRAESAGATATTSPTLTPAGTLPLTELRQFVSSALAAPVVIPHGITIPAVIQAAQSRGAGRVQVQARTTTDIFPSTGVVIPAGSEVEGSASLDSGGWHIYWTDLSIRGVRTQVSATNEEPAGSLRDRILVIHVR
jgi:hypothetical protein